jgi:hypothetical protein
VMLLKDGACGKAGPSLRSWRIDHSLLPQHSILSIICRSEKPRLYGPAPDFP